LTRLYLVSPATLDSPDRFAAPLRAALDGGDVAAFLLRLENTDDEAITRAADALRPLCQQRDIAFLLDGHAALAAALDCDGVQVAAEDYAAARRAVGPERQVGVVCPASRHLAMEVAEAGADYVAFDSREVEMIEWWGGLFEIPCVAAGDVTLAEADALIGAGADFLAVSSAVWEHGEGPKAAVAAFNAKMPTSSKDGARA
jgi:thiamine-phosphate pyrophosphorylase